MASEVLSSLLNDTIVSKQGTVNKKLYNQKVLELMSAYENLTNSDLRKLCREKSLNCGPLTTNSIRNIWLKRLCSRILDEFIADDQNQVEQLEEATTTCDSYSGDDDDNDNDVCLPMVQNSNNNSNKNKNSDNDKKSNSSFKELDRQKISNANVKNLVSEIKDISQEINRMKDGIDTNDLHAKAQNLQKNKVIASGDNKKNVSHSSKLNEQTLELTDSESNIVTPRKVMFWSLIFIIIAAMVQIFLNSRRDSGLPEISDSN